jgi:hypothetical protein
VSVIAVRPIPTTLHRYKAEEMSGPLPAVLYKVLSDKYARRLVDIGEMMWSTLTWFQNEEHAARGDGLEGTRTYFPVTGVEVTRQERNGRPDHSTFTLPAHGLVSRAAQSNHIFIYSMTLDSTLKIDNASTRACVEVFDPHAFVQRVRDALKRHRTARAETLIHDSVRYWSPENPPEEVWALPDRLTMHKHEDFKRQSEYRLAFGTRADVFDFERVECFVTDSDVQSAKLSLEPQRHRLKLRVGSLRDCCQIL